MAITTSASDSLAAAVPAIPAARARNAAIVGLAMLVSMVFDWSSNHWLLFLAGIALTAAGIAAVFAARLQVAVAAFLFLVICSPDLTQSLADVELSGYHRAATIWQLQLGPVVGGTAALLLIGVLLLRMPPPKLSRLDVLFLAFFGLLLPLVTWHYGYLSSDSGLIISDIRPPVLILLSVLCFTTCFRTDPPGGTRLIAFATLVLAGRFMVDLLYLLADIQRTVISDVNRVSVDSAKGLVHVLFFIGVRYALSNRVLLGTSMMLGSSVLTIAYQTRLLWATLILGVLLLPVIMRPRRAATAIVIIATVFLATSAVLTTFLPEVRTIAETRLHVQPIKDSGFNLSRFDFVRYGSIVNSQLTLWERGGVLTGLGYGSWFSDKYLPIIGYGEADFGREALETGRIPRIHDFLFHMLFKYGVLGTALYTSLFAVPAIRLIRRRCALSSHSIEAAAAFVLIAMLPTALLTLYWSSKGVVLAGCVVAMLRHLEQHGAPVEPARAVGA